MRIHWDTIGLMLAGAYFTAMYVLAVVTWSK